MPESTKSPAEVLEAAENRGVGIGMAIAAGIVAPANDVVAAEILHAAGLTTKTALRKAGVDQYDIDQLSFTLKCIADRNRSERQASRRGGEA